MNDALISIKPRFAKSILIGKKRYELRRRAIKLEVGTRLWIYATLPIGAIQGYAYIKAIHYGSPKELKRFINKSEISILEYDDYFLGSKQACAIELCNPTMLNEPLLLHEATKIEGRFHPPQFFKKLHRKAALLHALVSRIGSQVKVAA